MFRLARREPRTPAAAPGSKRSAQYAYDAFISYSHAVDGRLAPALQLGLHRFARRWNQLRAVRVFRDEASLSANAQLWPAILTGLTSSRFLILIASPEAARSVWVDREAAWWVANRPLDRVLLVLTDGHLVWDGDAECWDASLTDALPPALLTASAAEPRWVDLRWARSRDDLSLRHAHFRSAVADLAASLHGVDKDLMLGADVREHRRTKRLATVAAAGLACLALLVTVTTTVALLQQRRAEREASVSMSRYLASQAVSNVPTRLDRSLLLAVEAMRSRPTVEARDALLRALQHSPHLVRFVRSAQGAPTGLAQGDVIAVSGDGHLLATAGSGAPLQVWDTRTGRTLGGPLTDAAPEPVVTNLAFSPDGAQLAAGDDTGLVRIWRTSDRTLAASLQDDQTYAVETLAFAGDGRSLAVGSLSQLLIWNLVTQEPSFRLGPRSLDEMSDPVFVHDDAEIAFASADPSTDKVTVETWSRQTGELVRSSVLQLPSHVMQVEVASVEELALSPDARLLAVGTTGLAPRVMLWDVATRRQQGDPLFVQGEEYTGGPLSADARRAHLGVITSLRFDAAGKRLAAGSASGRIKVWDVPSTYLVASLDGHGDRVTGLSFLDDATLASTSADHAVAAWTLAEPSPLMLDQPYHESYGASAMAVSPDGRTVVAGEANGLITVWNTDEPLSQSHFPTADRLLSLAVSPDGSTLASTHADATVRLWSLADGTPLSVLEPQAGPVWTATFSQDGSLLAAGTNDGTTVVWDVASSRRTHEFALRNAVKTVAFSPDGNFLSSAGSDNRVVMWDLAAEDVAWSVFASERSFVSVEDVAFSPDGGTLAVAASDGVLLLDAGTGAPSGALDAPLGDAQYTAVAFALDGRLLAAASSEGALLWDRAARQQIGDAFSTPSPFGDDLAVDDVAFARSGHLIGLSTGLPKRLHRWPTRSTALLARACQIAGRDLSATEWRQYLGSRAATRRACPPPGPLFEPGTGADADAVDMTEAQAADLLPGLADLRGEWRTAPGTPEDVSLEQSYEPPACGRLWNPLPQLDGLQRFEVDATFLKGRAGSQLQVGVTAYSRRIGSQDLAAVDASMKDCETYRVRRSGGAIAVTAAIDHAPELGEQAVALRQETHGNGTSVLMEAVLVRAGDLLIWASQIAVDEPLQSGATSRLAGLAVQRLTAASCHDREHC